MGIKQTCANFNEISAKILACLQPPPPLKTNISELEFFLRGGGVRGRLYTAKVSVIDDKTTITTTTTTNSKRDKSKYKHNL